MDLLQRLVIERSVQTIPTIEGESTLKMTYLSDHDIEAYLMTFERLTRAYEVDRARWVFKLAPQLTGKAQQAYAAMSAENSTNYEAVKA